LATEALGFVVGSSNRGVVYFQLDPPVVSTNPASTPEPKMTAESKMLVSDANPMHGLITIGPAQAIADNGLHANGYLATANIPGHSRSEMESESDDLSPMRDDWRRKDFVRGKHIGARSNDNGKNQLVTLLQSQRFEDRLVQSGRKEWLFLDSLDNRKR
jgi:hypothetical protein